MGFIREEVRIRRSRQHSNAQEPKNSPTSPTLSHFESNVNISSHHSFTDAASQIQSAQPFSSSSIVVASANMLPAITPSPTSSAAPTTRCSPLFAPLIPLHIKKETPSMPQLPQPPLSSDDATPMPLNARSQAADDSQPPSSPVTRDADYFSVRARQSSAGTDDFAAWGGQLKQDPTTPVTPGGGLMGRLKSLGKVSGKKGTVDTGLLSPVLEPMLGPDTKNTVSIM